jgi:hypothetical protein
LAIARRSQFPQFLVNDGRQLIGCLWVALLGTVEDLGDIALASAITLA